MAPIYIQVENIFPLNVAEGYPVMKEFKRCGAKKNPKNNTTPSNRQKIHKQKKPNHPENLIKKKKTNLL